MKKIILIFLSFFLFSIVSASPSLDFQHEEIHPGETILATITTTGEFTKQIQASDITFYQGRKQIFFESDITFYQGTHYLYIYTTRQGNFSVQIKDILYQDADGIKSNTINKYFNVTNETAQILSIKPGFVFTSESPTIKLSNKGTEILNITYDKIKLSLEPSEAQEISLIPTETFSHLDISSYKKFSVPIILATNIPESPPTQLDLKSDPKLLLVELFTNNKTEKIIQLFNLVDEDITNIQALSGLSFVTIEQPENMASKEIQNLTVTFNAKTPGHFQSNINITYTQNSEEHTLLIPLSLFILPEGSNQEDFGISEQTCGELGGTVCTTEEICEGEATFATKNKEYCCLGSCKSTIKDKSETSFGWLIALIIFAALGGGGYYLYKKQKKIIPKKPEEQLKESSEKFDKRMKESPKAKRISGKIVRS